MSESQFFHGAQPWGYHTHSEGWTDPRYLIRELDDLDRVCFDCPLAECDQHDPRCPFHSRYRGREKQAYDIAYKLVRREVQRAEQAVREATNV